MCFHLQIASSIDHSANRPAETVSCRCTYLLLGTSYKHEVPRNE